MIKIRKFVNLKRNFIPNSASLTKIIFKTIFFAQYSKNILFFPLHTLQYEQDHLYVIYCNDKIRELLGEASRYIPSKLALLIM